MADESRMATEISRRLFLAGSASLALVGCGSDTGDVVESVVDGAGDAVGVVIGAAPRLAKVSTPTRAAISFAITVGADAVGWALAKLLDGNPQAKAADDKMTPDGFTKHADEVREGWDGGFWYTKETDDGENCCTAVETTDGFQMIESRASYALFNWARDHADGRTTSRELYNLAWPVRRNEHIQGQVVAGEVLSYEAHAGLVVMRYHAAKDEVVLSIKGEEFSYPAVGRV